MAVGSVTIILVATIFFFRCRRPPRTTLFPTRRSSDLGDNTASFTDHVICPDVRVTKTGNGTINAGETATFNIKMTHHDPGPTSRATAHDTLHNDTWTLGGANAADCSITAGVLNCSFGT